MAGLVALLYMIAAVANGYMWANTEGTTSVLWAIATIIWALGAGIWFALALNE